MCLCSRGVSISYHIIYMYMYWYTTIQGVGDPPADSTSTRSRHPTGGTLRATSHMRSTGAGRAGVEEVDSKPRNTQRASQQNAHGGENPPLPDRLVERLKSDSWEDRREGIRVLEEFVDRYPKALEPHMLKVCVYNKFIYTYNIVTVYIIYTVSVHVCILCMYIQ